MKLNGNSLRKLTTVNHALIPFLLLYAKLNTDLFCSAVNFNQFLVCCLRCSVHFEDFVDRGQIANLNWSLDPPSFCPVHDRNQFFPPTEQSVLTRFTRSYNLRISYLVQIDILIKIQWHDNETGWSWNIDFEKFIGQANLERR